MKQIFITLLTAMTITLIASTGYAAAKAKLKVIVSTDCNPSGCWLTYDDGSRRFVGGAK